MLNLAREVFEERHESADEAKEEYTAVNIDVDDSGHLRTEEREHEHQEPPDHTERFAALFQKRMDELKEMARAFPRDRAFGGWSGKPKTDLVDWILRRQEVN